MNVCGEDQPAASQTSWRASPDIRAMEAAILLVEWDRTAIGESLTGRLISKWDGLDHPLAHLLLRCRGPLVRRSKTYEQLFIFYATGQLCGRKHLMPALGKANCLSWSAFWKKEDRRLAAPQPQSTTEENEIPGGLSPMTFHQKECGKHLWPPHKLKKMDGTSPAVNRSCRNSSTVPTGQLTGSSWWSLHHEVKTFHFKSLWSGEWSQQPRLRDRSLWAGPPQRPSPQFPQFWLGVKYRALCLGQKVPPDGELQRRPVEKGYTYIWEPYSARLPRGNEKY